MSSRECLYCANFFECKNKSNKADRCMSFSLNPGRAEDYREFVNEQVNNMRVR